MSDESHESISAFFEQLAAGSDQEVRTLWERCFDGLLVVARNQLGDAPRRSFDAKDVVLSVFECLRKGAEDGRFDEMRDRTDLWKLLVTIAEQLGVASRTVERKLKLIRLAWQPHLEPT